MNKKLTLKMESKDFSISKKDRPITAGGGTLAIGNGKKL